MDNLIKLEEAHPALSLSEMRPLRKSGLKEEDIYVLHKVGKNLSSARSGNLRAIKGTI